MLVVVDEAHGEVKSVVRWKVGKKMQACTAINPYSNFQLRVPRLNDDATLTTEQTNSKWVVTFAYPHDSQSR